VKQQRGFTPRELDPESALSSNKPQVVARQAALPRGRSRSQVWLKRSDFQRPNSKRRVQSAGRTPNTVPDPHGESKSKLRMMRHFGAIQLQRVYRAWRVRALLALMVQAAIVIQRWYSVILERKMLALRILLRFGRVCAIRRAIRTIRLFGFFWRHRRHRRARQVWLGASTVMCTARCTIMSVCGARCADSMPGAHVAVAASQQRASRRTAHLHTCCDRRIKLFCIHQCVA
jgi:hypothetical protein